MDIKPGQKWAMHGMHYNKITILSVENQEVYYTHDTPPDHIGGDSSQQCSIEELVDWGSLSYEPPSIYDELELMLDE